MRENIDFALGQTTDIIRESTARSSTAAINGGFTPVESEVAHARAVAGALATNPAVGALKLEGRMIDRPHLVQARRLLAILGENA